MPNPASSQPSVSDKTASPELALDGQLEAVLFASPEALSAAQLARVVQAPRAAVETGLTTLERRLKDHSGLRLSHLDGHYRLVTAPQASPAVVRLQGEPAKPELSRAALETLAIVAYRGPLTRSAIDSLRGVSSDSLLRNLLGRGLVREAGRSTTPGKPMQYGVSQAFLEHFGLTSLQDLPPLAEPSSTANASDGATTDAPRAHEVPRAH